MGKSLLAGRNGIGEIVEVTIDNPFSFPTKVDGKGIIMDVHATDNFGRKLIIEAQNVNKGNFVKRSIYYTDKVTVEHLKAGGNYSDIPTIIFIGILNYDEFGDANPVIAKANTVCQNFLNSKETKLYQVALEMAELDRLIEEREAAEEKERARLEKETLIKQRKKLNAQKQELSEQNQKLNAQKQELSEQKQQMRASAKEMKGEGVPIDLIAKWTGLSIEQVEKIKTM